MCNIYIIFRRKQLLNDECTLYFRDISFYVQYLHHIHTKTVFEYTLYHTTTFRCIKYLCTLMNMTLHICRIRNCILILQAFHQTDPLLTVVVQGLDPAGGEHTNVPVC